MNLLRQVFFPSVFPGLYRYLSRLCLLLISLPVFALLQLTHGLALLVDEILFRDYRKVVVQHPVFILGVPRSGTTHTHQILAGDCRFTTVKLWECLFAPSVTERYLYACLARVDRGMGAPFNRILSELEGWLLERFNDIHPIGLQAPEEDFLLLTSRLDCFLLVLIFPECDWLWKLSRADSAKDTSQRTALLIRYRRLLQRHLYFHGEELQLLSKNASFAGLAHSLGAEFPDALFVICERDAQITVRSQFRSIKAICNALSVDKVFPAFEAELLNTLYFYYQNLQALQDSLPARQYVKVPLWRLSREPRSMINSIYTQLGLDSVKRLDIVLRTLEQGDAIKPATCNGRAGISTQDHPELARFASWRHAPENRL